MVAPASGSTGEALCLVVAAAAAAAAAAATGRFGWGSPLHALCCMQAAGFFLDSGSGAHS